MVLDFDVAWPSASNLTFVVKPVPKGAQHAITRLPVAQQLVDAVSPLHCKVWVRSTSPAHMNLQPSLPSPQLSNVVVIKAAVENFSLTGRLRLTLRPLFCKLPLVGSGGCPRADGWEGGWAGLWMTGPTAAHV